MVLQMSRPHKNPKSGVYYFRQKTPADLVTVFRRKEVSRSLRTKDPHEAKLRNVDEVRKQELIWAALRKRPEPLPHQQIVALSGILYRDHMAAMELEPGSPKVWTETLALLDRVAADPDATERWYAATVDNLLLERGIVTDAASRSRLIQEADRAYRQVAEQQLKCSEGDYSPDPRANRFPTVMGPNVTTRPSPEKLTIRALFKLWERDHLANGKSARTVGDFRQKIESLIEYLDHDDARQVTSEGISDWCDHLLHEQGLAARTVSQKYLAVTKLVFGVAVEKRKLKENPAEDNRVRFAKPRWAREKGFTDDEAKAILTAALVDPAELGRRTPENMRAIRWGPWICAFSGARITEAMQLRTEDLIENRGILCLRITPEAGSVKTGAYRIVPIHPQLLEMGLPEMIRALPDGPVFYSTAPVRGKPADPVERAQSAGAKVGQWVRKVVGITDPRAQPNHF
ncbi:site-specific integrase [Pseudogemmobacter faecipullorum]|uniref:Integrase n=1 Tax=Pseudogemmobacter faecipullorum TaxID=2755041 RepID=A0ABS8CMC1_9RHOB|nr:site-specific integrase [Pseudogemmobacter faecipullorum]MCB5410526.1 integrase [Pseudogemmobacter faecipullorum]